MLCLETVELTHFFSGSEKAVNKISLRVKTGSIYGFLGPNGAGKTTTMRLLLGLLKKQSGSIFVFGKSLDDNRSEILKRVGSLIESPSIYSHLTATENLRVLQKVYRSNPSRIPEVLSLVGLPDTGKKKAGQFSLGMKQRLSIALSLMHQPDLLILDEPTNGLDPNGIIEIRELLRNLNRQEGTTILISSHLLAEIERLVTDVGIISKGAVLFQGTLDELKTKQQQSLSVVLETSDIEKAVRILNGIGLSGSSVDGKLTLPALGKADIALLNRELVAQGVEVYEIAVIKNDLESIFMDLINN